MEILKFMLIAGTGGFVGTCCRFLINRLFLSFWKLPFPLATFTINILGCFIFGIIIGILSKQGGIDPKINALLIVGFCGGFTTFSTFSFESFSLASNGEFLISFVYISASVIAGFLAIWLAFYLTR